MKAFGSSGIKIEDSNYKGSKSYKKLEAGARMGKRKRKRGKRSASDLILQTVVYQLSMWP